MSFPYSLSKTLIFNSNDYWVNDLPENFHQLFTESLKRNYDFQEGYFYTKHSLFNISIKFDVKTELDKGELKIVYHLHLQNLVNVIIAILLLSAFLSKFSFGAFLWFSFVISIVFYRLSSLIINSGIKKQISQILSAYKKVKKESDIEYWVKENDRNCPACGALVDNQALFCKECGLKIRQNAYSKPLNLDAFSKKSKTKTSINTTKTSSENRSETNKFTENRTQINYQYKKKNDK